MQSAISDPYARRRGLRSNSDEKKLTVGPA